MQKLVVLLHANDVAHPSWAVVDDDARVSNITQNGDPAALPELAKNRIGIVIVPAEDVLLTNVTLPKMNRSRLLQAIPYALEEQIIEDVDTMHFAAGSYHANELLPVLVTSRAKMTAWMSLLQSFGIKPDVMLPAVFALPYVDGVWQVQVNDVVAVRTGLASGFACDEENIAEMLMLALSATAAEPQKIEINNSHAPLNLSLPVAITENHVTTETLMENMARQASSDVPVNLLQGTFQNKKARGLPKMTNLIKAAAYMGAIWLVLMFLYPVVSFAILDQRTRDVKTQITAIYKRQFPNSSSVVAPKERMQQKLNKLNSDLGDNHLLLMMANVGKGLSQSSGVTLKRMDFQNNVMTLEISAASSDIFSSFTDALAQQGLHVKQQNATLNGTRVNATLEIE